jgi:hypothetical protein
MQNSLSIEPRRSYKHDVQLEVSHPHLPLGVHSICGLRQSPDKARKRQCSQIHATTSAGSSGAKALVIILRLLRIIIALALQYAVLGLWKTKNRWSSNIPTHMERREGRNRRQQAKTLSSF